MDLNPLRGVPGARSSYALRFGAALFVVLLVLGVFGSVIYAHTGSELEDDVESQLVNNAESDAERLDGWLESSKRNLASLTRSLEFRNDDRVSISDSLHRLNERPGFEGAYYVNAENGTVDVEAGTDAVVEDGRLGEAADERLSSAVEAKGRVTFTETFETADGRPAMLAVSTVPGDSDHVVVPHRSRVAVSSGDHRRRYERRGRIDGRRDRRGVDGRLAGIYVDRALVSGRDRHRLPSGEPKVGSEEFAAGLEFDTREVPREPFRSRR
ncbi:hypothetical protein [Haloterrigena salifodinae]|uniref:hypothetical protein n=1 Tax=Haloterrigena salifodinae TaxID=2675099 RepID=UPI001E2D05EA|nr:hypothetical protein [Haloterrigena salifodinae]